MNKQDIDRASSALTGAINYFSPMVIALNKADEVFSVLSNALKHKDAIEKEVDTLKAALEPLKAEVVSSKEAITANNAAVTEAKAQAEKDIAEAKAQADADVKTIKTAVADRTKKSIADAEAKIAAVSTAAEQAKAQYENDIAVMTKNKADIQTDITALETKLDTLREQAKKFAASLVE